MMVPPDDRAHFPIRFALFALIALSALAVCSLYVSGTRSASAAPVRLTMAGAVLAVSPTNLSNCRQCTVTVINESPTRSLTWSVVSRGIPGVKITPAGGTLQHKGQVSVTITMPSNITCPANDTITFTGPMNLVKVSWSCVATPVPTPTPTQSLTPPPVTPTPTPTTVPTPSSMPSASPTLTGSSPTPTATSLPNGGVQNNNGNSPPGSDSQQGSSVPSILLSVAALMLALLAFTLYLIPSAKASLRNRLLSLILPVSFLRRLD